MKKKVTRFWQVSLVTGTGLLIASYWLMHGFLSVLEQPAFQLAFTVKAVLPGIGLLFMIMMGRRQPLPYGTALILTGAFLLLSRFFRPWPVNHWLILSIPLIVLGALFIWIKPVAELEQKHNIK